MRAALVLVFATMSLGLVSAGCSKPNCAVTITKNKVGEREDPVFTVVNRGTVELVGAKLQVVGTLTGPDGAAKEGTFSAAVDKIAEGQQRIIGQDLLRTAEGKPFDGQLQPGKAEVLIDGAAVCTSGL